jgi:hypothetical protein
MTKVCGWAGLLRFARAPYKKHPIENQALSAVFIAQASSHIRVSGGIGWLIWRDKGFIRVLKEKEDD